MAVVHQRISQLNSSGLMNIESSHKFNRSGDTASGCVEAVNIEVGVLGGRRIKPTTTDIKGKMYMYTTCANIIQLHLTNEKN